MFSKQCQYFFCIFLALLWWPAEIKLTRESVKVHQVCYFSLCYVLFSGIKKLFLVFQRVGWYNPALETKIVFGRSIDCYDTDPGGEATFCGGHKITVLIWPVGSSKALSTLNALGV